MDKYELMVLVKGQSPQEEKDAIYKQTTEAITKNGGKVVSNQVWLEKHKLAFSIQKCWEATFYLIKFDAATSAIEKMRQAIRLNEGVLRYLITRIE